MSKRKRRSPKLRSPSQAEEKAPAKAVPASRFIRSPLAAWLIPAAAAGFIYLSMLLLAPKISFDLSDQSAAREWRIVQGDAEQWSHSERGLTVRLKRGYGLLAHSYAALDERDKTLSERFWKDTPYVKFFMAPEDHDRTMILVWWISDRQNAQIPFVMPAMAESVVVDTRARVLWRRIAPFFQDGRIRRIGIGFPQQIEISRVEFLSVLNPGDLLKTVYQQLRNYEPIAVSSINFQYGLTILGRSYILMLGLLVLAAGMLALIVPRRGTCFFFFMVCLVCTVSADLGRFQTLWHHAGESYKISSLYDDRYQEFRSRFGEEFAQLDRALKKHVPEQSRVAFPESASWLVMGETNWIWFLYQGEYENNYDRGANAWPAREGTDYVFYYYPRRHVHAPKAQALLLTENNKEVAKVELVSEISEHAKLLRIIHD